MGDDERWLFVEESEEGLFHGSGGSWKPSGEWVGYGSLAENDIDLDRAIAPLASGRICMMSRRSGCSLRTLSKRGSSDEETMLLERFKESASDEHPQ